jgi:hypothetical protein
LPSTQPQFFLEWTHTIPLEEDLRVASEMLEVGTCSSLQSPKLTRVVQRCCNLVNVLAREDVEFHLHALETKTEQFQLCE